jgi:hypothetical protein
MVVTQQGSPDLPDIVTDDGDRPSITEVNGSIAKLTMAYSPGESERFAFGAPMGQLLPSVVGLAGAVAFAALVLAAYNGSPGGLLYHYIVEGDRGRQLSSHWLMFVLLAVASMAVVRNALRGVIVTGYGIETRTTSGGIPRVRKWAWTQIDRLVLDDEDVMLELWNGTYERLPKVREPKALAELLERIAAARGRPVTRLEKSARR